VRDRPHEHDLVAVVLGVDHREAGLLAEPAAAADEDLAVEGGTWRGIEHRRPDTSQTG
jgi:hypothetical protein